MYTVKETEKGWCVVNSKDEYVSAPQPKAEAEYLASLFNKMKY